MHSLKTMLALAGTLSVLTACSMIPNTLNLHQPTAVMADARTELTMTVGKPLADASLPAGTGAFRVTVTWPDAPARSTLAIPTRTDHFVVSIQGSGIQPAIIRTIYRTVVSGTQTEQIVVPAGASRIVTVEAQNAAGDRLATGQQSGVNITAGQFSPVTVSIASVVGNVRGTVINGDTGAGVAGATVQVDWTDVKATTATDGTYTLLDVPAGTASVTISGTGLATTRVPGTVTISADQTTAIATVSLPVAHWIRELTGTQANLYGVSFADTSSGWAVGENNHILHTADGGKTWTEQFSKYLTVGYTSFQRLFSVKFRDALNGWAVGAQSNDGDYRTGIGNYTVTTSPIIVKTADGGQTWTGANYPYGYPFTDVTLLSPSSMYVSGNSYSEYSSDNGATWTQNNNATGNSSFFVNSNVGYLVTGNLYYTNTGGTNWAILNTPSGIGNIMRAYFSSTTNGSAITDSGKVIQTTDGGANWTLYGSAPAGTLFNSFHFNDQNFGYGVANSGIVYITADGGKTWKSQILPDGSGTNLYDVTFVDSTHGWAVGANGRIYGYQP